VTDDQLQPPAGGLLLTEALERYRDPKKWDRYQSLGAEIDWNTRYVMSRVGGLTDSEKLRARKVSDFKKAQADVSSDLFSKLRSGDLVAWARDGSPNGPWREIPSDSWTTLSVYSWEKSILSGPDKIKFYSAQIYEAASIENYEGVTKGDESSDHEPSESLEPPKGKGGRKPKYRWDLATRELMQLADSLDGLPHPQARIEKHLADWFDEKFDVHPAESTIRKFVSEHLPPNYEH